jgi:ureidoacrylate peracid hydrolase
MSDSAEQALTRFADPATTALVIVDIQNDFVHDDGKAGKMGEDMRPAQQAVNCINRLIQAARAAEAHLVYLRIEHSITTDRPNYRARYEQRGMQPDDLLCAAGSWGADWYDGLERPRPQDAVVTKYSYDGFQNTPLDAMLQSRGAQNLVMTGVVTNLCVQTTAEHGFGLGYYIAVAQDATAGDDAASHEAALRNLGLYFGTITETDTLLHLWRERVETQ